MRELEKEEEEEREEEEKEKEIQERGKRKMQLLWIKGKLLLFGRKCNVKGF